MYDDFNTPKKKDIISLLTGMKGSQFIIPVYQRNYTWKPNVEILQFIEDIEDLLINEEEEHFLGTIIFIRNKLIDHLSGAAELSVIDGQQRLTTIFLSLYAIKEILKNENDNENLNFIENQILNNEYSIPKYKHKLKPLVSDDDVFQKIVENKLSNISTEEKKSSVFLAYEFLKQKILIIIEKKSMEYLIRALRRIYIVIIPMEKGKNPQKIFESINSTGAKLSTLDLIRNFLLMNLEDEEQDKLYYEYWYKMENNLKKVSNYENFFRYFLALKKYYLYSSKVAYKEFKIWTKEIMKNEFFSIEKLFNELLLYSEIFSILYSDAEKIKDKKIEHEIKEFRKMGLFTPAPLVMELLNLYFQPENSSKKISYIQFNEMLNLINTYFVRRAISDLDLNDISRLFPSILEKINSSLNEKVSNVEDVLRNNLVNKTRNQGSKMPDNEFLKNAVLNSNAYKTKKVLRIILEKIENYKNNAPVDLSKLNIEHILPQSITEEWIKESNMDSFEEAEKFSNMIGNLTLASSLDNSKMGNSLFENKKEILEKTGHLNLNEWILEKQKWTKETIVERSEMLIGKINEIYPYQPDETIPQKKHNIFLKTKVGIASAFFYEDDGSVEILEDSEMSKNSDYKKDDKLEDLYYSLVEDGIIEETTKKSVFKKTHFFQSEAGKKTALSKSAKFLLRTRNNIKARDIWVNSDGIPLEKTSILKKFK